MTNKREAVARMAKDIVDQLRPAIDKYLETLEPGYERRVEEIMRDERIGILRCLESLLSAPQYRDVGAWATSVASTILATLSMLTDARVKELADFLIIEAQKIIPPSVAVIPEGWQPFRTAPRDGTPFLAYWERRHTDKTRYDAALPYVVAAFYANTRIIPTWVAEDLPTHWMPLPAAPGSASPSPVVDAGANNQSNLTTEN